MKQEASLFIGYRRQDSQGFAGRVADDLIDVFGTTQVFRDDDIPEGSNFPDVLQQALSNCDILIAVIGPNWLAVQRDTNLPRLFQPDDWVRREIETALNRGIWILPVLVGSAVMPTADKLPESLKAMSSVQAMRMSDRHWDQDFEHLVELLTQRIPALKPKTRVQKPRSTNEQQTKPLSLKDSLEKIILSLPHRQYEKSTKKNRVISNIRTLLVRMLWSGVALMVAWYIFENHTTPELRKEVFNFIDFAQSKLNTLFTWFDVR